MTRVRRMTGCHALPLGVFAAVWLGEQALWAMLRNRRGRGA